MKQYPSFILLAILISSLTICHCEIITEGEVIEVDPCDIEIGLNLRYIVQKFWGENTVSANGEQEVTFNFDFFFIQPSFLSRTCFRKGIKSLQFLDSQNSPLIIESSELIEDNQGVKFSLLYNKIGDYSFASGDYQNGAGTKYKLNMILAIGNTRKYVREYTADFSIIILNDLSIQFSNFLVSAKTAQASASFAK